MRVDIKQMLSPCNYTNLRKMYVLLFITAVFSRAILPIAALEPQIINSLVFAGVAFVGFSILMLDAFHHRHTLAQHYDKWLCLFLLVCAGSSLLNAKYGITANVRNIVWLMIYFFLICRVGDNRTKDHILKEIDLFMGVICAVWLVAVLVSFAMFLFKIGYYVILSSDDFVRQGFIDSRLFGIFEDPNFASIISLIVIIFSVYKLCSTKSWLLRLYSGINILFQFIYLVLSGSRTAEFASIGVLFFASFILLRDYFQTVDLNKGFKLASSLILSLTCCGILFSSINVSKIGLSYLPGFVDGSGNGTRDQHGHIIKPIITARDDVIKNADISNCRFKIWSSASELFLSAPVFGTSPRNMIPYAKDKFPHGFIAVRGYSVHNAYLELLTSTGILGAIFIAIFFIRRVLSTGRHILSGPKNKNCYLVLLSSSLVACVAVSSMFLSDIFFINTIGALVFWLFTGYLQFFIQDDTKYLDDKGVGSL